MQKMERASLQVDHVCHCIHIKGNTDSILLTKKEKTFDFLCDACSLILTPGINLGIHFDVSQDYRD